ncbi:MOSC domain-containing protein [Hyalangium rubrum]|uniref:MOSC domain-containing protein n=1 Tax=Hyalangium rubrum TaxID=3103134 RepID=A0ABU5H7L5_9BACT|nr:MOSC domain-containing protein [Hyalangium sp. s54d21]MDY7228853.1 MOSC domain-containing protein [Hyalangium sp. s54d21]
MPALSHLFIHPLKSTRGLSLTRATVEPMGLENDRRWMLVRSDGSFITGRENPSLVLVSAVPSERGLRVSAPGHPDLEVPVPPADAPRLEITIWKDQCSAPQAGQEADRWFSRYLGEPTHLVFVDARMERPVDPHYAAPGDRVGFTDGFPLLLVGQASLEELNRRLPRPITMEHFRPNLVVEGSEPFAEDSWKRLRVGEVELEVVKPCARCVFTTVDPRTGQKAADGEPLRTLATFRRSEGKVMFGQNVLVRRPGTLQVGDPVQVLE